MIAAIVPVLGRPERAAPLAESFRAAVGLTTGERLVFIASYDDGPQREACLATGETTYLASWRGGSPGDWARKINLGYRLTGEPYLLLGADDLRFHPGWAEAALAAFRPGIGVVGTNDLGNPLVRAGRHATHPVVARAYADEFGTVDGPGAVVSEAYSHCWVDNELVETAMSRGAWAFARDSYVEHLHPAWRKSEDDATYRRGQERYAEDRDLFIARRHKWGGRRRAV